MAVYTTVYTNEGMPLAIPELPQNPAYLLRGGQALWCHGPASVDLLAHYERARARFDAEVEGP